MNEFDNGNDLLASMLSELNSDADSSPVGATVEPKPPEEIEQLDNFSYDGYQVVRREFFAHIQEPSITFSNFKVYVNQICVNKLPDVEFVQMLVNSDTKILAIRPCEESDRDSLSASIAALIVLILPENKSAMRLRSFQSIEFGAGNFFPFNVLSVAVCIFPNKISFHYS